MPMFLLTDDINELVRLSGEQLVGLSLANMEEFDGDKLRVRWVDGTVSSFVQPNMLCLGFLTLKSDMYFAEALNDWWHKRSGLDLQTCALQIGSDEERRSVLLPWILRQTLAVTDLMNTENRALIVQNMQLRRSYESQQAAFSRLEAFVTARNLHTPVLQYETGQINAFWLPSVADRALIQLFPVLSTKLSFFELFFRKPQETSKGKVTVTLRLEPAGRTFHVWQVDYAEILNGWNRFTPPPLIDLASEIVLELTWSEVVRAPMVGLSLWHWNIPYGGLVGERDGRARSVALRIWSGLAGVRATPAASIVGQDARERRSRLVSLPQGELLRARHHEFAEMMKGDFAPVHPHESTGRLIIRPHGEVPTIAILPDPLPTGTTFLSAECKTVHERGPVIEYAMAALASDVPPEQVFTGKVEVDSFSGWHAVKPITARRLMHVLSKPAGLNHRLCLATRLSPGQGDKDFAWASWYDIEIGIEWRPQPISVQGGSANSTSETAVPASGQQNRGLMALPAAQLVQAVEHDYLGTPKSDNRAVEPDRSAPDRLRLFSDKELPTIAVLPDTIPSGTMLVSAACEAPDENAFAIEYAVAIVLPEVAPEAAFAASGRAHGFSGWHTLGPRDSRRISVALGRPAAGNERLCLATRLPPGEKDGNRWATFRDIKIAIGEVLPLTLSGTSRADEVGIAKKRSTLRSAGEAAAPGSEKTVVVIKFSESEAEITASDAIE